MMSYPIIFQTKVVKINDNEIIHFNRVGCNNDTKGRVANIYEAKIRTIEDFKRMAEGFMINSKPYKETGIFDLKVGSKWCSFYDYGMYLLRALKRADDLETFKNNYTFKATIIKGIEVTGLNEGKPFKKVYFYKEYPEIKYNVKAVVSADFSKDIVRCKARRIEEYISDVEEAIEPIRNKEVTGETMLCYVKKEKAR